MIPDDEGADYTSVDDAIGEAAEAAREIIADRLLRGEEWQLTEFRIVDNIGQIVALVRFADVGNGHPFPPPPPIRTG